MEQVLEEYKSIQKEIKQLEEQIERLESLATSPRVSDYSGLPRSGRVSDGMDVMAKICDLITEYYEKLGRFLELQEAVEKTLEGLSCEERVIIRYKYIDGLKNVDIADKVAYSESTIKRRIRAALDRLTSTKG